MKTTAFSILCFGGLSIAGAIAWGDPTPPDPARPYDPTKPADPTNPNDPSNPMHEPIDPVTNEPLDPTTTLPPALPPPSPQPMTPPPVPTEPPVSTSDTYPTTTVIVGETPDIYSYAWREPALSSGIGVGVTIGGGISGFTGNEMRGVTRNDIGGLWDARLSLGTHVPLGIDVSYVGTATKLATFGTDNGTLFGTTVEAALRYNVLPHFAWTPYFFGGAGWQHYDVRDARLATSDTGLRKSDDLLEFPMGAGVSYRSLGAVLDLRGTFRAATSSDLVIDTAGNNADLHTWEASGALGFEF